MVEAIGVLGAVVGVVIILAVLVVGAALLDGAVIWLIDSLLVYAGVLHSHFTFWQCVAIGLAISLLCLFIKINRSQSGEK